MYLHLVFNKSAYRSLLYIYIFLFVKTIFDIKQFSSLISGECNRISGRIPDIKKGRISGTTLIVTYTDRYICILCLLPFNWDFYRSPQVKRGKLFSPLSSVSVAGWCYSSYPSAGSLFLPNPAQRRLLSWSLAMSECAWRFLSKGKKANGFGLTHSLTSGL